MAEHPLHRLHVGAGRDRHARRRVPEVVHGDVAPQFEVILAGKGGINIRDYVDVTIREKDQRAAVRGRMGRR